MNETNTVHIVWRARHAKMCMPVKLKVMKQTTVLELSIVTIVVAICTVVIALSHTFHTVKICLSFIAFFLDFILSVSAFL